MNPILRDAIQYIKADELGFVWLSGAKVKELVEGLEEIDRRLAAYEAAQGTCTTCTQSVHHVHDRGQP